MPLEQPRRDNLLMARYFDELRVTGKELARRAGVSHSQVYMARNRHVGARNAQKIVKAMSHTLGLSTVEELELKAEIMGEPGNLLRAYLGNGLEATEALGEEEHIGHALIAGNPLANKAGNRVLDKLGALCAPETVISRVRYTIRPKPSPSGRRTYTLHSKDVREQRDRSRETLRRAKPTTQQAITASGLSRKEIYERANIGRETLRKALFDSCGAKSAAAISAVLAASAGLSPQEQKSVRGELITPPEGILGNSPKKSSETR